MRNVLTVASVILTCGFLTYAVYFDHKRRNDVDFRKRLRKDKKRVDKTLAQSKEAENSPSTITTEELRAALETVRKEDPPPKTVDAREQYFMTQVSLGEQLASQGPLFYLPAAMSFYRALRVYPSPVELIVIYQKTVPEPIFKIVMEMTNLDTKDRVEGYYEVFPPKSMNVSVKVSEANGSQIRKKILVVNKDFAPGDIIYKENPVVAALDFDLQGIGTHCSHCLRHIQKGMAIVPASDPFDTIYCSKDCQVKSNVQSHNLLFSLEPPLPSEMGPLMPPQLLGERKKAQMDFVAYIKHAGKAAPLLVAKFIARQVAVETANMMPNATPAFGPDIPEADGGQYTLYDHIERLRYLEVPAPEEEMKLLRDVLRNSLPGLEQFVTDERHATLLGKMGYNMYGICFGGGRDDKPLSTERPENVEKTRTPYGTARQIGSGFYTVSSYISHSCTPTARPSFSNGTSELHLIANCVLKKGDEVTVSYVDVTQHAGESPAEAKGRRRMELARGWRFACACSRCQSEGETDGTENNALSQKDESKVEEVVTRVESQTST